MTAIRPNWTDEEVATLTRMWGEGSSAGQIGKVIGRTRNSVIGRINRMGLTRKPTGKHGGTVTKGHKPKSNPLRKSRAKDITIKQQSRLQSLLREQARISKQREEAKVSSIVCEPVEGGVELLDLRPNQCRWALGDDLAPPPFKFCGAQTVAGKSWCSAHLARAFQPDSQWKGPKQFIRQALRSAA